jgi:hypothetical protein
MSVPTSTKTITRLGVLTVMLSREGYRSPEFDAPEGEYRYALKMQLADIVNGHTHVPTWKVRDRSLERCAIGGQCLGYQLGNATIITGGLN